MKNFEDKVAVITAGGSGIGEGFVKRCISKNMKVVFTDINSENLKRVETELLKTTTPNRILPIQMDVGNKDDILRLKDEIMEKFGQVDLLFNHAGMPGPIGPIWNAPYEEIERVLKVNLLSVLYSLRTFVPIMLNQNSEGHIVNTSSGAGLRIGPNISCYSATKRAVVTTSEILSLDLKLTNSKIGVSVLCPGMIATNFGDMVEKIKGDDLESVKLFKKHMKEGLPTKGIPVSKAVDETFDAIYNNKFYILTHFKQHRTHLEKYAEILLSQKHPTEILDLKE